MSILKTILPLSATVLIVLIGIEIYSLVQLPPLPTVDEDAYWGPGKKPSSNEDIAIKPFKINISDEILKDLHNRLESIRPLTPPLEGIQQQYGFNTNLLKKIISYWKNDYDWHKREPYVNQFPQFLTKIQGLNIHYVHVKPANVSTVPLLILHGWPASPLELYKVISILTKPQKMQDFAFEVIAPTLPGFGFSDGSAKPGFGIIEIAMVMRNLMKRIGHDKFYVQGGDWGSVTVSHMATLFPENVLGLHVTMCFAFGIVPFVKLILGSFFPQLSIDKEYEHLIYPISGLLEKGLEETGYFHLQATKPDTIGIAVGQSPAALAAYMLEKFSVGTNYAYRNREDAGLLDKFTYDQLLDNIMLYWITNSFTTSVRLYTEPFTKAQYSKRVLEIPIKKEVPCACARFPYEIFYNPDWILRDKYTNLIQTTNFDRGGHFSAFEEPELIAQDIFLAVGKMEKLRNKNK